MCMLGKLTKQELTSEPVEGYRGWFIKPIDNTKEKKLYPLNQQLHQAFEYNKESEAILDDMSDTLFQDSLTGFYAYNNYYNNNYNYHYYYNNYNYYNYNYYVAGKVILSGEIAHHKLGYRATKAKPSLLVRLTPKIVDDKNFMEFIKHFNQVVEEVAKLYNIPVIDHINFK